MSTGSLLANYFLAIFPEKSGRDRIPELWLRIDERIQNMGSSFLNMELMCVEKYPEVSRLNDVTLFELDSRIILS